MNDIKPLSRMVPILILLVLQQPLLVNATTLTDYTIHHQAVTAPGGSKQIQIRSFKRDGAALALVVDPGSLATKIVPAATLNPVSAATLAESPYGRALTAATRAPVRLQNHGVTHAVTPVFGLFLTVDLCPSQRPFEQAFFDRVANLDQQRPVPVAVAITGRWLATHDAEFSWLREQERTGRLAITWINHSLTHRYDPAVPLGRTFMLTPGIDRRREILDLEMQLIERGVVPSVFFRFPGLVADDAVVDLLRELGLIPLGSDAWLAKGEMPRDGSIILVHGNGNEPAGIRRFHELPWQSGRLPLLPLPMVISGSAEFGKD